MPLLGRAPRPVVPACPLRPPRSPKPPAHRQLWVRGWGLVWWLSRICCTSCSTEKPELLLPLLQVHLMPWTGGDRAGQRPRGAGEGGEGGSQALSELSPSPRCWEAGSRDTGGGQGEPRLPANPPPGAPCSPLPPPSFPSDAAGNGCLGICSRFPKCKCTRWLVTGPWSGRERTPLDCRSWGPRGEVRRGRSSVLGRTCPRAALSSHLTSRPRGAEGTGPQGPPGLGSGCPQMTGHLDGSALLEWHPHGRGLSPHRLGRMGRNPKINRLAR